MSSRQANRSAPAALVMVVTLLVALEVLKFWGLLSQLIFAAPSDVAASWPILAEEHIVARFLQTFGEALAATIIASLIGLPIGWCLARYDACDLAYRKWIAVIGAAPLILMYPVFLVAFGRNAGTIVAVGTISALPPIILNTRDGFRNIKRVLLDVGRMYQMRNFVLLTKILLPAAAPAVITGVRLAGIFALVNVVAIEFVINYGGIGYLVGEMADRYEIGAMYGAIAAIVLASALFYVLTERLERWLRPY
jgi:NitT/TauT family transport system permease protein